jgi:hypothetical protein
MASNYQEKMIVEINKFLAVYNKLSGSTIEIENDKYPHFIRMLGHYFYLYNSGVSKCISFGNVMIDMRVFNDTPYQNAVKKFLESLNKAFQSNLDDEINNYITTTTDFTEDEKKICLEVQGYMSRLQASMKKGIFNDAINHSVTSNEVMSSYSDTLKEFNEYTKTIATDPLKYDVVDRFKKMLPVLAAQKIQPDIFFDA